MKISQEVLTVLSQAHVISDHVTLRGQLDRKLYLATNKVLEACGGKWNRKAKAHVFDGLDAGALLETVLTEGEVVDRVKELQFFPTPDALARRIVSELDIQGGDRCLEPSAGTGALAKLMAEAGGRVTCVEIDEGHAKTLHGVLNSAGHIATIWEGDFLDLDDSIENFDIVAMNPPFRRVGRGDALDHTRKAVSLLKKNGQLRAVLPASVLFREDRKHREFREWAQDVGQLEALPEGSFKESGTGVSTALLSIG